MRVRRCQTLLIEPRESLDFDLQDLTQGGDGLRSRLRWVALAPHLDAERELSQAELLALGAIGSHRWVGIDELDSSHDAEVLHELQLCGLLISDSPAHAAHASKEQQHRDGHWHGLSAVMHSFGRWQDVDSAESMDREGSRTLAELVNKLGTPPPHYHPNLEGAAMRPLPRQDEDDFDALLARRTTCRNFDIDTQLPLAQFSQLLQRCFATQGTYEAAPGATILKKHSPSGGGLHATEAYLLVQRVEDISPGLYHYHGGAHALARLEGPDMSLDALALTFVAGQHWFSPAHVLVVLAPRFTRSFWKYRNHAKAYRALVLDVGHLSQTLYLSATEMGLGAFVTAAINEVDIERVLGLDPAHEGPLAICGFGPRAAQRNMVEFDPQGRVWPTNP